MRKIFTASLFFTLFITTLVAASPQSVEAYTRLTSGSVWNEDRLLQDYGSPNYKCIPSLTCQNDNSASVVRANNTAANQYLDYMCVNGKVCQDRVHTEIKYMKSIIGPASRLGNALIPSVTSVRTINSQGEDVTYDACVQPGEEIEITISSEHRTCGTRAIATHYEVAFNAQAVHAASAGGWSGILNTFTGGFKFKAPLEEGEYSADIAVINPHNIRYHNLGFNNSSVSGLQNRLLNNDIRSGYYTYELGRHTVNVCQTDDNALRASCYASPIQTPPNTEVTFTGNAAGGVGPYTYRWEDGVSGKTRTENYTSVGSKPQRVIVQDSAGNSAEASCAVSVTNNLNDGVRIRNGGDSNWSWSTGDAYIPLGEINAFGADRLVTNDSCAFEWETTGMDSCRILRANGDFEEVETTGTKDLPGGGTYTLECFDIASLQAITSQPVRCTQNPNIREI